MKISKDQAAANRRHIIKTAALTFQSKGVDSVGVNEIMKACGFTHGGFYNHFESKEDLISEAMSYAFEPALKLAEELTDSREGIQKAIEGYLSETHRNDPGEGCPSAGFVCDAVRQSESTKLAYSAGLDRYLKAFAKQMTGSPDERRRAAIKTFASMVGAMLLARATHGVNETLSDEILEAVREDLLNDFKK
jgi:TetR/AcrR family transcriptional regulator, transcriptional repressor for nem operon